MKSRSSSVLLRYSPADIATTSAPQREHVVSTLSPMTLLGVTGATKKAVRFEVEM